MRQVGALPPPDCGLNSSEPSGEQVNGKVAPDQKSAPGKGKPGLQVLAAWLFYLNSWGLLNSFGVYQAFYAEVLLTTEVRYKDCSLGVY